MKKIALLTFGTLISFMATAQWSDNFNSSCATSPTPNGWTIANSPYTPSGNQWQCTPNGKPTSSGSPTLGATCTGVVGTASSLDTSYLVTPGLNFNHVNYPNGHVYLNFDSKKENLQIGARLSVGHVYDSMVNDIDTSYFDLSAGSLITPAFGDADASWVTHQVDVSQYLRTDDVPVYLAFRYVSSTAAGTAWYIDNVNVTKIPLVVERISKGSLPLTVIGESHASKIELSYRSDDAGTYDLAIFDMTGRDVYNAKVTANAGRSSYIITDVNLRPGIYCIRMGNEHAFGTTKLMVQ